MTITQTKNIINLTEAAAERVKDIMATAEDGPPPIGLRISVKARGCSGKAYTMDYVSEPVSGDEVVEDKGVTIYIDPAATLYLIGTEMDYHETALEAGFTFKNPNEKGRCGCGESFHV